MHAVDMEPGSFRDPRGRIHRHDGRIYRSLNAPSAALLSAWEKNGALAGLSAEGGLLMGVLRSRESVPEAVREAAPAASLFLEQPRLPLITYPYEWPLEMLKRAALLHLDLHLAAIERGFTITDGSAFNLQFMGARPIFMDALSFVPMTDPLWYGYRQFCEEFLGPLLLGAKGYAWQATYRGNLRGIPLADSARALGLLGAWRRGAFLHIAMQAHLQNGRDPGAAHGGAKGSRDGLRMLLLSLRRSVARVTSGARSHWADYETDNTYSGAERTAKAEAVRAFVGVERPARLLDLGCNTGEYSQVAVEAGAAEVVAIDDDAAAMPRLVGRADRFAGRIYPIQMDVSSPSPSQGWAGRERSDFFSRVEGDAILALALVHHLVLAAGIPLSRVLPHLVSLAPRGLIEFVPPDDPMSLRLIAAKNGVTHPYDEDSFARTLSEHAAVVRKFSVSRSGRVIYWYRRA